VYRDENGFSERALYVVDLDQHPEAVNQLRWWTGGSASHPTVYVGGEVLIEPNPRELNWVLARSRVR
jgi:mycoredoxin